MNRKPLIELTADDLRENPVWEYWMADNIEYVTASNKTEVSFDSKTAYIVATDFIFNNKSKHLGFCSPQEPGGLENIQPVVFVSGSQVEFYKESDWTDDEKENALLKLGFSEDAVFPVTYRARIKFDRIIYEGTLTDFNEEE